MARRDPTLETEIFFYLKALILIHKSEIKEK